jgi:hypothetical protein
MLALCVSAAPAFAAEEKTFEQDRQLAEKQINPQQHESCLKDFSKRIGMQAPLTTDGPFSFNEYISRDVYHMLYWEGGDRGVAFTAPVKLKDPDRGQVSTNVACFYAVKENKLVFQYAQQVSWKL